MHYDLTARSLKDGIIVQHYFGRRTTHHSKSKSLINKRMIKQFDSLYALMFYISMPLAVAGLNELLLSICFIAFACNTKRSAIVCAFFFLLLFFLLVFRLTAKSFLANFPSLVLQEACG